MKRTGIRKVRQELSALLREIRRGREILITDRGAPVAKLVPPEPRRAVAFRGRAALRAKMPRLGRPVSQAIAEERDDRL